MLLSFSAITASNLTQTLSLIFLKLYQLTFAQCVRLLYTFETGTKIDSILLSRFLSGDEKLIRKSATTVTEIMSRLVKVHGVLRYDVATSSYLFERPIVRDIVYNAMNDAMRCELHLKVGDLLTSSNKNIFFSVIGRHYMKASGMFITSDGNGTEINAMVQRKAIYYLSLAADEAMEYGDVDRSVTLLKHVLSCIATVTDVADNDGFSFAGAAYLLREDSKEQCKEECDGNAYNLNVSSVALRCCTYRKLAECFWELNDLENARFYLCKGLSTYVKDVKDHRIQEDDSNNTDVNAHDVEGDDVQGVGDVNGIVGGVVDGGGIDDSGDGVDGIDHRQAGLKFHEEMTKLVVLKSWKKSMSHMVVMRQLISTRQTCNMKRNTIMKKGIIEESVIRHEMEEKELVRVGLLAAVFGMASGWDVLGIYHEKKSIQFFIDIYHMLTQLQKDKEKKEKEEEEEERKIQEENNDQKHTSMDEEKALEENVMKGKELVLELTDLSSCEIDIQIFYSIVMILKRRKKIKPMIDVEKLQKNINKYLNCMKKNKEEEEEIEIVEEKINYDNSIFNEEDEDIEIGIHLHKGELKMYFKFVYIFLVVMIVIIIIVSLY